MENLLKAKPLIEALHIAQYYLNLQADRLLNLKESDVLSMNRSEAEETMNELIKLQADKQKIKELLETI